MMGEKVVLIAPLTTSAAFVRLFHPAFVYRPNPFPAAAAVSHDNVFFVNMCCVRWVSRGIAGEPRGPLLS